MGGLLRGVGMGAACSAALLIPFPLLVLGVVLAVASQAARKRPEATPEQPEAVPPEGPLLTQAESEELDILCALLAQAPDDKARAALVEEFYPDCADV